jgi:uncharacterized protein with GYD domain
LTRCATSLETNRENLAAFRRGLTWPLATRARLDALGTADRLVIAKASAHGRILNNIQEDLMPTFMMSLNWTDQGIRAVKDSPKRSEAARDLAKKVGVEIKHLYLTSGDSDLVIFVDAPSGDNVAKFALAVSSLGNVRTRTVRAWSAEEYRKLISELP